MNRVPRQMDIANECVPNIGLRGRRRRATRGVMTGLITVGLFGLLWGRHAGTAWFLAIAPIALLSAIYFFQAREKT